MTDRRMDKQTDKGKQYYPLLLLRRGTIKWVENYGANSDILLGYLKLRNAFYLPFV